MKKVSRCISLVLAFALCIVSLGACGGQSAPPTTTAAATAAATTQAQAAATTAQAPATTTQSANTVEYKMAMYAPAPHPTFENSKIGVERFMEETGIDVRIQIGPDWEQSSENNNVQALAATGITHFALCPADGNAAIALVEELNEKGLTVVNFSIPIAEPNPSEFFISTDVYGSAETNTETMIKLLNGKGKILVAYEVLSDSNTQIRKQATEDVVARYPDVEIIQEIADMKTVEEATQKITDALSGNIQNIDGILLHGFVMTIAVGSVMSDFYDRGGDRHIFTVGTSYDDTIISFIRDGIIDATMANNPKGQTYVACHALKLMTEGWKVKPDVSFINSGYVMVTKENADNFEDDLMAVSNSVRDDLTTVYLTK